MMYKFEGIHTTADYLKFAHSLLKGEGKNELISLAPNEVFQDTQKTALSAVAILDIATTAMTIQPDFKDLKGVDDLKDHQKKSKADANKWRSEVRPILFSVNDAIINYNTEFSNLYIPLYDFAGQLSDPDKCRDAQYNLIAGLQNLQVVLKVQKDRVDLAAKSINDLRGSMMVNESLLNADLNAIRAKYEGDKGKLADMESEITAYAKAMNNDLAIIGFGAAGAVVGGLVIAVGVLLWLESAGGSTPLLVIGVAMVGAGTGATIYGIYDYNVSSNRKAEKIGDLSKLNAEIAVAKSLTVDVATLVSNLDLASEALKKLSDGWGQLDRDYQNVIEALTNTQGNAEKTKPLAFIVQANLRTSKQQWDVLVEDANTVKKNLMAPIGVDSSALDNSDGKTPSKPNVPLEPEKNLKSAHKSLMLSPSEENLSIISNTGYKQWVENTAKAIFSFEKDMGNLIGKNTSPAKVVTAKNNLMAIAHPALETTNLFLTATEELSRMSSALIATANLGDDTILDSAIKLFAEVDKNVVKARQNGQTASDKVSKLEESISNIDAALSGWLSDMKAEQSSDKQKLEDVSRLRNNAQKDKENLKNDFWFCFFGAIVCAGILIEVTIRMKNAQSEINEYNSRLSKLDKSLSELLTSINETTKLAGNSLILNKSIDGGLTALQVIKSTVDGINANIQNLTPFILRAHLKAVAEQIQGVATVKLKQSAHMLFKAVDTSENKSLIDILQGFTSAAMMVQLSAIMTSRQPKLSHVENLLKQDQELLFDHAAEWILTYSNSILSEFSGIRALGDGIQYLGKEVLDFALKGDMDNAEAGIDSIVESISSLMANRLFNNSVAIVLFNENIKNDQSNFHTVGDVLRKQLSGESGELATMEAKEIAYTAVITESLTDIVNNSTRVICENLAWGVVLAISIGTGQIEFAGAAAPTIMYLVKKGANLTLKAASDGAAALAKAQMNKIVRKGDDIDSVIEERSSNLAKLSLLKADMAILKILTNDVSIMKENTATVLESLSEIKNKLQDEIHAFYAIKYALKSSNPEEGVQKLKASLETWEKISTACSLLEKTWMLSFSR